MKPLVRVVWVLAAVVGVTNLAVVWLLWQILAPPMPSDAALSSQFREHRAEFDTLAAMAMADTQLVGLGRSLGERFGVIVLDTPHYNRRLSDSEALATGRTRYQPLMQRAGLPFLSRARGGDGVWFVIMSSRGARKGYVYSEKPMAPIVSSLDKAAGGYGYVELAPRWFLFRELSD